MSPFRLFDEGHLALLKSWCASASVDHQWTLGAAVGMGESASRHVTGADGVRGIAKPALQAGSNQPRAAHEKIASDLADLLGIPVPAVTLWTDPSDGQMYSISAYAFPQALTWGQSAALRTPAFNSASLPALAAGYVFHTWIADTDHGGNEGNIMIDVNRPESDPALAFIDHAFSMSYQWTSGSPACTPLPGYYAPINDLPLDCIEQVVKTVQSLPTAKITEIVDRVPPAFLEPDRATIVKECLLRRQGELSAAFPV